MDSGGSLLSLSMFMPEMSAPLVTLPSYNLRSLPFLLVPKPVIFCSPPRFPCTLWDTIRLFLEHSLLWLAYQTP